MVLHVETGMIVVAVGSTTQIPEVEVSGTIVDRDPALSQMRLRLGDVTRFYECHIQPMEWSGNDFDIRGRCLGGRFDRLFGAMEKIARESLAGARTITPIPRNALSLVKRLEEIVASKTVTASPATATGSVIDSNVKASGGSMTPSTPTTATGTVIDSNADPERSSKPSQEP